MPGYAVLDMEDMRFLYGIANDSDVELANSMQNLFLIGDLLAKNIYSIPPKT